MRQGVTGLQADCAVIARQRLLITLQRLQGIAAIEVYYGIGGPQRDRAVEAYQRRAVLSQSRLDDSEKINCIKEIRVSGDDLFR